LDGRAIAFVIGVEYPGAMPIVVLIVDLHFNAMMNRVGLRIGNLRIRMKTPNSLAFDILYTTRMVAFPIFSAV